MSEQDKKLPELSIQFPGTKPNGRIRFGLGVAAQVGGEISDMTDGRVLIITDRTIVSLGVHKNVTDSLEKYGINFDLFDGVLPEPHIETMGDLERMFKDTDYGAVIGLGGGSTLDTAKLAAVMAYGKHTAQEIFDNPDDIDGSLPTVLMPTTSGTGSEVSPYSVMADGKRKRFISSPYLYATVALVDPLLTVTMPPRVTAATGLDALTHGVEGAIGKDSPYTRAMALQCAGMVFRYLPRAVKNGDDIEARYYMSLASVMGMLAYTQGGGLYAHSMSYVLTTRFGCPHGLGCGMALGYTLRLNQPLISDFLKDIGGVISQDVRLNSDEVISHFLELVRDVGMPTGLKDVGVTEDMLDDMAACLVKEYYRALNPVSLTLEDARVLVHAMYEQNIMFSIN